MKRHWLEIVSILFISTSTSCLELSMFTVPRYVPLSTKATLSCRWQLSPSDVLYSVKWYKDGREFFRHVPRNTEPRRQFPLPGVHVEVLSSDYEHKVKYVVTCKSDASGSELTLGPAVLETSGRYRCEVSGEKPLFPTVSEHADLIVVELPKSGPTISGLQSRYRTGDQIQVNCTSGPSRPAMRLAWYLNGEPAPIQAVGELTRVKHPEGMETAVLRLDYEVKSEDFIRGAVKVKCLATVGSVYWRSNEESALEVKLSRFSSRPRTESERFYDSPTIWRENVLVKNYETVLRSDVRFLAVSVILIGIERL